ncbi:hypothetical protein AMATHDRAFT_49292 [Amanita thiersii Skay4041]|uniref:Uncharacterized protein n=1 Tax=Amanita thiersii Skay4041 TaxID=703135 RepID=A0A2A9NF92_9AGAR|nr:hypothetical protein AMATHDRAFT_49292 [Amanita thiersii Skay4041]
MSLTRKDIRTVARRSVKALEDYGHECCLFGSVACYLWGMENRDPNFYLVPGKSRHKRYHVLWYTLRRGVHCKVDIVTPNTTELNIPDIPLDTIDVIRNIPVMSFLPLLLLKLQGWDDHRNIDKTHMRAKIPQDKADLKELLTMLDANDKLRKNKWLPSWFAKLARARVREFVNKYPYKEESWSYIGFHV